MNIDPIQIAVIQNGLRQVASEMDLVHQKTSFSPIISEGFDRANGIFDLRSGSVIAQGELGLPIFIGIMQFATAAVIRSRTDIEDGDIVILNDPYRGGTHLMDVKLVTPFYYQGKQWCWLSNCGHWADIGGMTPGGFGSSATEIHQEGLRIPPVKLLKRGVIDQDMLSLVMSNVRVPEERMGDLKAQIGALQIGQKRLTELLDRFGADVVAAVVDELRSRSEQQMRACLSTVPDGEYPATAWCDSDGVSPEPLKIQLRMTVAGSNVTFDFAGSSAPCRGPMNCPADLLTSAVYVAMKHVFPEVPINAGCFAPVEVLRAEGTFLDAQYPQPCCGAAAEVSARICEAVFVAVGQAIPEKMFAAPFGTSGNLTIGGYDPANERNYILYMFTGGGYGGWWETDGLTNGCSTGGISKTQPVEILEQQYPVLFDSFALREDSAGAGRHRGGFGVNYRVRLIRGTAKASFMMDHGLFGPPGLLGGEPGQVNTIEVNQSGEKAVPLHTSKGDGYELVPGDWLDISTPGGGGYGAPAERTLEAIDQDVARGYFSSERAAEVYPQWAANARAG